MMNLSSESEKQINQYLKAVQRNTMDLSKVEQDEILENLRAHIYSVLNDMDPPESYAAPPIKFPSVPELKKRTSRRAIIGAIFLPFGFFLALWIIPSSSGTTPTPVTTWQIILRFTLLPLSILAPFAATIFGLLGISEIRNSAGQIYGMPLALFVSLFYPILVLDLILFIIGWSVLSGVEGWDFIPLLWLILVLTLDYFIIRISWRAANQTK
jgi:hypothetical protein